MGQFNVIDYGAAGDGQTLCTSRLNAAIQAAETSGGGTVVVPAGRFLTGTLTLKSHVHLHLEAGAVLLGSDRRDDYESFDVAGEYASGASGFLLQAFDAEDVTISGPGEIDQRGRLFMDGWRDTDTQRYIRQPKDWRPRMVGFYGCRRVTFRDVTLRDAASWCVHLTGCDDVVITGCRILNDLRIPNCDGIDPDHRTNVRISDCHIEAGDDCIVVKATRGGYEQGFRGSHNIVVSNCTCVSTSAAIKIGTESHADMTHILVTNCVIRRSSRGLAIQLRDHGNVENVIFSNCTVETRLFSEHWWGRAEPIYVTSLPRTDETKVGSVRHVRFSNILCRSENGAFIAGCETAAGKSIDDVVLDNVRLELDRWTKWPGGQHDRRPIKGGEHTGISDHPTVGVFVENADGVQLREVDVVWAQTWRGARGDGVVQR